MFEWLINLPVWVQTPLMVVLVLLIAAVCAWALHAVMWKVIPPSRDERVMLGQELDSSPHNEQSQNAKN